MADPRRWISGFLTAALAFAPLAAQAQLERLAALLAAHCLVGWDTGGVPWDEL